MLSTISDWTYTRKASVIALVIDYPDRAWRVQREYAAVLNECIGLPPSDTTLCFARLGVFDGG